MDLSYLLPHATERQAVYIHAYAEHGSYRAVGRLLEINDQTVRRSIETVKVKAALAGHAPGHFENGVAPGYAMGKVTVQRAADGAVERTWERQSPDALQREQAMREAAAALAESLPRVKAIHPPTDTNKALCNLYILTDAHVGALAWHKEGGADWDLKIAEQTLTGCFMWMVDQAPKASEALICQLGDFLHWDGLLAVTPGHGHVLDGDGRFSKMVGVAIRILRRVIDYALARHDRVTVIMAEGNHDEASSVWLRLMFAALYENEPRVAVNDSELPYYVHRHGETMLAFHHGHKKKNDQLPILFASQYPGIWGATTKRYAHTGHRHHGEAKEHSGMTVTQHPTLAARDAYAARGGWISERQASAITYHSHYGRVGEVVVCPEMLEAA
jgi:hypothetical protein